MKRFLIWVETARGDFIRTLVWQGDLQQGMAIARADAYARGAFSINIWASPIANN